MSLTSESMTPADIAAVTRNNNGNNGGWGGFGDAGFFIIILFLFAFLGWGNGGFGFGGGNGSGQGGYDTRADIQRGFDNSAVITKLDGITQGICDSTYALNNGINAVGAATQQGFAAAELSRCNQQAALMQMLYTMSANQAECCCQTQRAIDGVNYNLATQSCDTRNTIQNTTRDIIDNQNNGIQAIMGKLSQMEYNNLNDKYQTMLAENQALKFQASQTAQNAFFTANQESQTAELLRRLGRDCPVPAYWVNPPTPVPVPCNPCGNNCGC